MLRASSMPALAECPCFESGGDDLGNRDTEAGTDRHKALELHFQGDDSLLNMLPEEDQDGIKWAADYMRVYAPIHSHPITWEKENHGTAIIDLDAVPGTPDAICHLEIFDLKWRERDYTAQMALYAILHFQRTGIDPTLKLRVHLLFGCLKRVTVLEFDRESAMAVIEPILNRYNDWDKQPSPCDYCHWCANRLTCSALNERAQTVAAGREDWKLQQYHSSQITSPAEMSKALTLAKHLSKWCEAVEHHAKEMVLKQGLTIPGYDLKSRAGKSSCADVEGAFNALPFDVQEFLSCCDLRLETSKENPDKKGVADLFAAKKGISKASAKREVKTLLQDFMRTPKETFYLKSIKSQDDES